MTTRLSLPLLLALSPSLPLPIFAAATAWRVQVAAGDVARSESVAELALPARSSDWRLLDSAGREVPLQVSGDGRAAFLVRGMAAGGSATYRLEAQRPAQPARPVVALTRSGGRIAARVDGRSVWEFHEEKSPAPDPKIKEVYRKAGYLHPVLSPSGALVTGDYPSDHYHHHGIWWAWVKTSFEGRSPDFWNVADGTGRVDLLGVDRIWSGSVHGGLTARFQSIDLSAPQPTAALNETWELRVYPAGTGPRPYWVFDLTSTQTCASSSPIKFPTYRYGGLGIRGHAQWNGKGDVVKFFPSNGITDRLKAHESRATWCHMGGLVDGKFTGLAALAHPENFRAPEPMRVNPNNPFLNFAPSQLGEWEMVPGRTYVWRYRFIVHDGEPNHAWLESRWADYARPVKVSVAPN